MFRYLYPERGRVAEQWHQGFKPICSLSNLNGFVCTAPARGPRCCVVHNFQNEVVVAVACNAV